MIHLKTPINKAEILRQMKANADEVYSESHEKEDKIAAYMSGVHDVFQRLQLKTEAVALIDKAMASNWKHLHEKDKGSSNARNGHQGVVGSNGGKNPNNPVRSADRKDFNT